MSSDGKRIKRWAPKVFSGCLTCKRRRIKCDETKPSCLRCGRSNLQCEGYATPQPRIFEPTKKGEQSQQPRASQSTKKPRKLSSPPPSPSTLATLLILDSEDQQSFDYYMRETAVLCSIYSRRHFWTVVVPQASTAHPAVKHSLLALSIVHQSIVSEIGLSMVHDGRLLHHYNAAIRAITQGQPTTDVVLISSMMFFFIDFFRRDGTQAASHHMEAALKILDEFKAGKSHTQSTSYDTISKHIEPIIQMIQMFGLCLDTGRDIPETHPSHVAATDFALLVGAANSESTVAHFKAVIQSLLRLAVQSTHMADPTAELDRLQLQLFRVFAMIGRLGGCGTDRHLCGRLFSIHHAMAFTLLRELKELLKIPETLHEDGIIALYTFVVDKLEEYLSPPRLTTDPQVGAWKELGFIAPLFTTIVRAPDEDLAERALKLLRTLDCTEGQWTSGLAADIAEALAQADVQDIVGFDLSCLSFERKPHTLRIYREGQEALFDHYLPLPADELDRLDLDATLIIVHNYGYQFHTVA